MKEHKLYGTYEQFFASDSQTFLVKKYARVCIVSDEFLVRIVDRWQDTSIHVPGRAAWGPACYLLCLWRHVTYCCGCAGSRAQHGPRHSDDDARRGALWRPHRRPPLRFTMFAHNCPERPALLTRYVPPKFTHTGARQERLRRNASLHAGPKVRSGRHQLLGVGARPPRSRPRCAAFTRLFALPPQLEIGRILIADFASGCARTRLVRPFAQFFASKKIRFVSLPETSIAYDVPEPVRA